MPETLDSRQLLAFCTLVQTGSFTETARKLNLTQSAISHSIKNLESDLSCQLVTRSGRKIHITSDGESFYEQAQSILGQMANAREQIRDRINWGRGRLRLGASTTACQYLLPNILREFNECFPDCILNIVPADTPVLLEQLRAQEVDLVIIVEPGSRTEVKMHPLFTDKLVLVSASTHPFSRLGQIKMEAIADQRLVLYNKGSQTFLEIEHLLRNNKVLLNNYIEMSSMEAIKQLVKTNYGVSFLPDWVVEEEVNKGGLARISTNCKTITRQWSIAHSSEKKLSVMEETFLGICQSVSSNLFGKN